MPFANHRHNMALVAQCLHMPGFGLRAAPGAWICMVAAQFTYGLGRRLAVHGDQPAIYVHMRSACGISSAGLSVRKGHQCDRVGVGPQWLTDQGSPWASAV